MAGKIPAATASYKGRIGSSIAEVAAGLVRHDADEPPAVRRRPDGEQDDVVARPRPGVQQDVPDLPAGDVALQGAVVAVGRVDPADDRPGLGPSHPGEDELSLELRMDLVVGRPWVIA